MRRSFLILLALLPLLTFAQKKKKKLTLEQQVAIAKQQELEAKANAIKYPILELIEPGAILPAFNVLTSDSRLFFDTNLSPNKPTILTFFNPGCDHCMAFASQLKKYKDQLPEANILFVAGDNLWGELKGFMKEAGILPSDGFIFSADHSDLSKKLFAFLGIPQVMIYNKEKILQRILYQDINKDSVSLYLNK